MRNNENWLFEITPKTNLLDLNLKEVWQYKDLLFLFVKRDVVTLYKQTILGPLWYIIQPLFTSVIFTLVFNKIASISTGEIPNFLFNLTGITAWNYFKVCFSQTSNTFTKNQNIFGKVYFPRVIMPMSVVISNLVKFAIQLLILIVFYVYFNFSGIEIRPNTNLFLFPVYVLIMVLLSLGAGMIFSALTTKYRDLSILLTFLVQLLMYVSAVPYPLAMVYEKLPKYAWMIKYNPIAQIVEGFRYMILDTGTFSWGGFFYTLLFTIVIFFIGLIIFNRTERTFIDTV